MGIHFEQSNFAQALRAARRKLGISQFQLADALGVNQSNITRWERAIEEVPRARRLELIDIFQNRQGRISPCVQRLLRNRSDLAVHNGDSSIILREADAILNCFGLNRSDVDGLRQDQVFDAEWKRQIDPSFRVYENTVLVTYERDVTLQNSDFALRCAIECMFIRLEPYTQVMMRRVKKTRPPTGEPVTVSKLLTLTDLDMWG